MKQTANGKARDNTRRVTARLYAWIRTYTWRAYLETSTQIGRQYSLLIRKNLPGTFNVHSVTEVHLRPLNRILLKLCFWVVSLRPVVPASRSGILLRARLSLHHNETAPIVAATLW